jgi:hypothetical protein
LKRLNRILLIILFFGQLIFNTSCFLFSIIPAPKRSFLPEDLLLTKEDIPIEWIIFYGPKRVGITGIPPGSMEITLTKKDKATEWDLKEYVYIYPSIQSAKYAFVESSEFPGNTNIDQWTYTSNTADDQEFSCYTYSNMSFPVCSWIARYEEIVIKVIAWLDPNRFSYDEVKFLIETIDRKVYENLKK